MLIIDALSAAFFTLIQFCSQTIDMLSLKCLLSLLDYLQVDLVVSSENFIIFSNLVIAFWFDFIVISACLMARDRLPLIDVLWLLGEEG